MGRVKIRRSVGAWRAGGTKSGTEQGLRRNKRAWDGGAPLPPGLCIRIINPKIIGKFPICPGEVMMFRLPGNVLCPARTGRHIRFVEFRPYPSAPFCERLPVQQMHLNAANVSSRRIPLRAFALSLQPSAKPQARWEFPPLNKLSAAPRLFTNGQVSSTMGSRIAPRKCSKTPSLPSPRRRERGG